MPLKHCKYYIFIILIVLIAFSHRSPDEWDIWWHMQVGEDILIDYTWPSPDTYSFTSKGGDWVVHSWLAGCVFYILYEIGGYNVLLFFRLLVI